MLSAAKELLLFDDGFDPRENGAPGSLTIWLDASDTGSITKNGSNVVSQWSDKSGKGNHFVAGSGSPLYLPSQINSKPAIQFSTAQLKCADNTSFDYSSFSIYIVCQPDSGTTTDNVFWKSVTPGQQEFILQIKNSTTANYRGVYSFDGTANTATATQTPVAGTPVLLELHHSGSGITFYVNGANPQTASGGIINGTDEIRIGQGATADTSSIAEALFYTTVHTAAQRLAAITDLAARRGLTLS